MMHLLAKISKLLDELTTEHQVSKALIVELLDFLYTNLLSGIRWLSPGIPDADNQYASSPLVVIYLVIASCLTHLNTYWPEPLYRMKQPDIPYCVQHNLDISQEVPIADFNMEELLTSMSQLELRFHTLKYGQELVQYVDALELRVCDFLLNCYDEETHNVTMYRLPFGDSLDTYVCDTSIEFLLIVQILSIRENLQSSIGHMRSDANKIVDCCSGGAISDEDVQELVEKLHVSMTRECKSIYGDAMATEFYKRYTYESISTSEGYMFLKENSHSSRIDPGGIIRQFRNISQWRTISETASKDLSSFFLVPDENPMAFRIVFDLIMNMLTQQHCNVDWSLYFLTGTAIARMSRDALSALSTRSHCCPIFVESCNDACIYSRGKLYVLGNTSRDFFAAIIYWLQIVCVEYEHRLDKGTTVFALMNTLLEREPDAVASASCSREAPGYYVSLFNDNIERQLAFLRIANTITSIGHNEMNASSVLADTDEKGVTLTNQFGW